MDADNKQPKETEADSVQEPVPPPSTPVIAKIDEEASKEIKKESPDPQKTQNRKIFDKPDKIGMDRIVELFLSCAIVYFAWSQARIAKASSDSSSAQVGKLIVTADRIDDAADRFSTSASHINDGVSDAVTKLNIQAGSLSNSATAANRLARATEKANDNVLNSDRPWIGALPTIGQFEAGKTVTLGFVFVNSGKRPAFVKSTRTHFNAYRGFPEDPDSQYTNPRNESPSTNFILPGMSATNSTTGNSILEPRVMELVQSGELTYYSFGKIITRTLLRVKSMLLTFAFNMFRQRKLLQIMAGAIANPITTPISAALSR